MKALKAMARQGDDCTVEGRLVGGQAVLDAGEVQWPVLLGGGEREVQHLDIGRQLGILDPELRQPRARCQPGRYFLAAAEGAATLGFRFGVP